MADQKRQLFLASESPRRKAILKQFELKFKTIPNKLVVEPSIKPFLPIPQQVRQLAIQKAQASKGNYAGLILSADTIVCLDGEVLGKPKSIAEAKRMLTRLSGKTHMVYTAVCLLDNVTGQKKCRVVSTSVAFKDLTPSQITKYCETFKPLDKAGGYGIQEVPDGFISYIYGCTYNVMGLPIKTLLQLLKVYDIV